MSERLHTPGPWRFSDDSQSDMPFFSVREPKGRFVVNITDAQHWGRKAIAANAHLIAASPDLLAACELLLHMVKNNIVNSEHEEFARAAILKAKGGTP